MRSGTLCRSFPAQRLRFQSRRRESTRRETGTGAGFGPINLESSRLPKPPITDVPHVPFRHKQKQLHGKDLQEKLA